MKHNIKLINKSKEIINKIEHVQDEQVFITNVDLSAGLITYHIVAPDHVAQGTFSTDVLTMPQSQLDNLSIDDGNAVRI